MDVDGGSTTGGSAQQQTVPQPTDIVLHQQQQQQQQTDPGDAGGAADIDMSFLQQFSCLGTTDHDELVQQLQKIMGNQLNDATARFFLDMNNWNLQAAVGCYFDFNTSQRLPVMRALGEVTVGHGEAVTPNTEFVTSWNVQNTSGETWPPGCYLKCTSHPSETSECPVLVELRPFDTTVLSVTVRSPPTLGSFQAKWRLCTSYGAYFGDVLWLIVTVAADGTLAETQRTRGAHPVMFNNIPIMPQPLFVGPLQSVPVEGPSPSAGAFANVANGDQLPTPEDAEMW